MFPARAGMSPNEADRDGGNQSVPRASGDEPPPPGALSNRPHVFPARAGMSPPDPHPSRRLSRVPRASGDEPLTTDRRAWSERCSPRERG